MLFLALYFHTYEIRIVLLKAMSAGSDRHGSSFAVWGGPFREKIEGGLGTKPPENCS